MRCICLYIFVRRIEDNDHHRKTKQRALYLACLQGWFIRTKTRAARRISNKAVVAKLKPINIEGSGGAACAPACCAQMKFVSLRIAQYIVATTFNTNKSAFSFPHSNIEPKGFFASFVHIGRAALVASSQMNLRWLLFKTWPRLCPHLRI